MTVLGWGCAELAQCRGLALASARLSPRCAAHAGLPHTVLPVHDGTGRHPGARNAGAEKRPGTIPSGLNSAFERMEPMSATDTAATPGGTGDRMVMVALDLGWQMAEL